MLKGTPMSPDLERIIRLQQIDHEIESRRKALADLPAALAALDQGEDEPGVAGAPDSTMRRVWQFDGAQFTPVDVRIGLTDGEWTQMVAGALRPGMPLVTSACQCRK